MYKLNTSTVSDEDGINHKTYGITYQEKEIFDISTNKEKIKNLIALCNEQKLSPIHLNDVIDDFLVENCI